MSPRLCLLACASLGALALACPALAQSTVTLPEIVVSGPLKPPPHRRPARPKPPVVIAPAAPAPAQPASASSLPGPSPLQQRYQLPQTVESITAERIERTVNVVDTADAVKYMPSLFVRKRNEGDNQAVLATRSWGLSSSARTLIYADDILLSSLIGNNNSNASPRWGMVAPEEIKRIDFLYGPFSAAYPGNSMGGVLNITTRMPDKFEKTPEAVGSRSRASASTTPTTPIGPTRPAARSATAGARCRRSSASISRTASASRWRG